MTAEDMIKLIEYGRQQGREEAARRLLRAANTYERMEDSRLYEVLAEASEVVRVAER